MWRLKNHREVLRSLGQKLKALRLDVGVTQEELAAQAGLGLGSIARIERTGLTSTNSLIRVLRALQVLDQFESIFQGATPSPIALLKESSKPRRQRVRHRRRDRA